MTCSINSNLIFSCLLASIAINIADGSFMSLCFILRAVLGDMVFFTSHPKDTVYFMEWSHGLETWSGVLEWKFGVEPWSEFLSVKENLILVVKFVSGRMYAITKRVTNA